MYLCTGFRQKNCLEINGYIIGYILYGHGQTVAVVRARMHQNVSALTKKSKSEIGLHHGILLCHHLGEKGEVKHNIMTKIMITLIKLIHYLT